MSITTLTGDVTATSSGTVTVTRSHLYFMTISGKIIVITEYHHRIISILKKLKIKAATLGDSHTIFTMPHVTFGTPISCTTSGSTISITSTFGASASSWFTIPSLSTSHSSSPPKIPKKKKLKYKGPSRDEKATWKDHSAKHSRNTGR